MGLKSIHFSKGVSDEIQLELPHNPVVWDYIDFDLYLQDEDDVPYASYSLIYS